MKLFRVRPSWQFDIRGYLYHGQFSDGVWWRFDGQVPRVAMPAGWLVVRGDVLDAVSISGCVWSPVKRMGVSFPGRDWQDLLRDSEALSEVQGVIETVDAESLVVRVELEDEPEAYAAAHPEEFAWRSLTGFHVLLKAAPVSRKGEELSIERSSVDAKCGLFSIPWLFENDICATEAVAESLAGIVGDALSFEQLQVR